MALRNIKGLLIDISGVLKNGDVPIPGSVDAIKRLQASNFPFRLVTNESMTRTTKIISSLQEMGFDIDQKILFAPVPAVLCLLKNENLRPHLLVNPVIVPEFEDIDGTNPNCVVIGDAFENFSFENMNECFQKLMAMENPILISLGIGKYYKEETGMLTLDVGGFTKCLEYATGVTARIIGKPSGEYFTSALNDLKLDKNEVMMIGDDVEFDVGGAQAIGLKGALVRSGKYTKKDENHPRVKPDIIVNNLAEAVDMILGK